LCQNDARCEAFDVYEDNSSVSKCSLYRNGICKATSEANTKMYAKSDFYEEPLTAAGKCTHLTAHNADAAKVQNCKD
jgi:hypothetical protein